MLWHFTKIKSHMSKTCADHIDGDIVLHGRSSR